MNEEFGFDDDMDEGIDLGMDTCEDCAINPATVHLTHVENNESETFHLCEECARRRGVPIPDGDALLKGIEAIVGGAAAAMGDTQVKVTLKQIGGGSGSGSAAVESRKESVEEDILCSGCRLKLSEFRAQGRLGCAKCYGDFEEHIEKALLQIHGSRGHKGKRYGVSAKPARGARGAKADIERLRRELGEAVSEQRFEQAAVIRDAIRSLEPVR